MLVAAKPKISLECDLCNSPAKLYDSEQDAEAKGWLKIVIESHYDDRSFSNKWICHSCIKYIDECRK